MFNSHYTVKMNTDKTKNYDMGKWNRWNVLQIFSSNLYFALAFHSSVFHTQ